jgi:hypothetical protein
LPQYSRRPTHLLAPAGKAGVRLDDREAFSQGRQVLGELEHVGRIEVVEDPEAQDDIERPMRFRRHGTNIPLFEANVLQLELGTPRPPVVHIVASLNAENLARTQLAHLDGEVALGARQIEDSQSVERSPGQIPNQSSGPRHPSISPLTAAILGDDSSVGCSINGSPSRDQQVLFARQAQASRTFA